MKKGARMLTFFRKKKLRKNQSREPLQYSSNLENSFRIIGESNRLGYNNFLSPSSKETKKNQGGYKILINNFIIDLSKAFNKCSSDKKGTIKKLEVIDEILINFDFLKDHETKDQIDTLKVALAEALFYFEDPLESANSIPDSMAKSFYICIKNLNEIFPEIHQMLKNEKSIFIVGDNDDAKDITYVIELFISCYRHLYNLLEKNPEVRDQTIKKIFCIKNCDQLKISKELYRRFVFVYGEIEGLKESLIKIGLIDLEEIPENLMLTRHDQVIVNDFNNKFLRSINLEEEVIYIKNEAKRSSIKIIVPGEQLLDRNGWLFTLNAKNEKKIITVDFDKIDKNGKVDNLLIAFFIFIYIKKSENSSFYDSISKTKSKNFARLHTLIFQFETQAEVEIQFFFSQALYVKKNEDDEFLFYAKKENISQGKHGKIFKLNSRVISVWRQILDGENFSAIKFNFKNDSLVLKSITKNLKFKNDNENIYDKLWQAYKKENPNILFKQLKSHYPDCDTIPDDINEFFSYLIAMRNSKEHFNEKPFHPMYNKRGKSYHFIMPFLQGETLERRFQRGLTLNQLSEIELLNFIIEYVKTVKNFLYGTMNEKIKFWSHYDIADRNTIYRDLDLETHGKSFELSLIDIDHAVPQAIGEYYDYYYQGFLRLKVAMKTYYLNELYMADPKKELIPIVRTIIKGLNPERYQKIESFVIPTHHPKAFMGAVEELHYLIDNMIKENEYIKTIPDLTKLLLAMHDINIKNRPSFSKVLFNLESIVKVVNEEKESASSFHNSSP